VYSAGGADEVRPMVMVKQGGYPEKGSLMMTTVGISDANVLSFLYAKIDSKYQEVVKKGTPKVEKDNDKVQIYNMEASQSNAIQLAYTKAHIPFKILVDKVLVLQTRPDTPGYNKLQVGDDLIQADELPIHSADDLVNFIKDKKLGDTIQLKYKRGNTVGTSAIKLANLPKDANAGSTTAPKVGIGIVLANVLAIHSDDPNKQVTVDVGNISGPSAGLMFSLEIYNQLVARDITKGYKIAGTGTITPTGQVGPIGGVQYKVIGANDAKATIFLVPVENAKDAMAKAKQLGSKMKIVPVSTMDDALNYLAALPPKT